jgi:hypothetical protein
MQSCKPVGDLIWYSLLICRSLTFLRSNLFTFKFWAAFLHKDSLSQSPDNNPYHSQLPWNIVHWVFLNKIYLSIRDQCDCDSSHQHSSRCKYMNISARKHHKLKTLDFLLWHIILPLPLPLLSSCKLQFPVVGLKISSLTNFASNSPNRILCGTYENN